MPAWGNAPGNVWFGIHSAEGAIEEGGKMARNDGLGFQP